MAKITMVTIGAYDVEIIGDVALIFWHQKNDLLGAVFIDHTGAWNMRRAENVGLLPVNEVLSVWGYLRLVESQHGAGNTPVAAQEGQG